MKEETANRVGCATIQLHEYLMLSGVASSKVQLVAVKASRLCSCFVTQAMIMPRDSLIAGVSLGVHQIHDEDKALV